MEVTIAVLAFVFKDKMRDWITDVLKDGMILRYQDDEDAVMDWFQENVSKLLYSLQENDNTSFAEEGLIILQSI